MKEILSVLGVILTILIPQIKRWSDAKPTVVCFVAGGENSNGQVFGLKLKNKGHISAYNIALHVTWNKSPVWKRSELPEKADIYIPVELATDVKSRETEELKFWLDYQDQFGRLFRASRKLTQQSHTKYSQFFIHESLQPLTTTRPNWFRDLLRWKRLH